MGAERWLKFEDPRHAEAYLEGIGEILIGDDGCWFEWREDRLEIGYTFGGMGDATASFISRELACRFPVIKVGADSVGWYDDTNWQCDKKGSAPDRYGSYTSWAAWIREYTREWGYSYRDIDDEDGEEYKVLVNDQFDEIENGVIEWFKARDAEVSS